MFNIEEHYLCKLFFNISKKQVLFRKWCTVMKQETVTDFLNFIMNTFTFLKVLFKVFDFCGVKVTMQVFNEEMCLLLKSCGLFYSEVIVILVRRKGSLNISVQSHSSKFIICRHLIFPLEIFSYVCLWYKLSVLKKFELPME